jgi:four helix bundle protein
LSDLLWNVYDDWEFKARQTIGIQMIRAANSIAVNIAEGYGRYTPNDRKRFYIIARGSLYETQCWIQKALRRNLLKEEHSSKLLNLVNILAPKLNQFIKSQNI